MASNIPSTNFTSVKEEYNDNSLANMIERHDKSNDKKTKYADEIIEGNWLNNYFSEVKSKK
jgi:hypothetical protein